MLVNPLPQPLVAAYGIVARVIMKLGFFFIAKTQCLCAFDKVYLGVIVKLLSCNLNVTNLSSKNNLL